MYEFLKTLFKTNEEGEPEALTFTELSKRLETSEIKLANLADGGYVSKNKFDAKQTELDGVKEQLDNANKEIQSYKDMDIDGIKKSVADWETKYNEDVKNLQDQLSSQKRAFDVETFLNGYKFTSKAAKDGIRAEFDKKDFKYEDGVFLGAKEYMETLKEDADYKGAFYVEPEQPTPEPEATPKPKFTDSNPQQTPPPKHTSLAELMRQKNENPDMVVSYD